MDIKRINVEYREWDKSLLYPVYPGTHKRAIPYRDPEKGRFWLEPEEMLAYHERYLTPLAKELGYQFTWFEREEIDDADAGGYIEYIYRQPCYEKKVGDALFRFFVFSGSKAYIDLFPYISHYNIRIFRTGFGNDLFEPSADFRVWFGSWPHQSLYGKYERYAMSHGYIYNNQEWHIQAIFRNLGYLLKKFIVPFLEDPSTSGRGDQICNWALAQPFGRTKEQWKEILEKDLGLPVDDYWADY
jgi:hypothetical protein